MLIEGLEEESLEDRDYYIDAATIDLLADGRATDHLVQLLRTALGGEEEVEIIPLNDELRTKFKITGSSDG